MEFPASGSSAHGGVAEHLSTYDGLVWLRPEEMNSAPKLFGGGSSGSPLPTGSSNVIQGRLDDCYLVSAMSLLARHGKLLTRLFPSYEPEKGRCTVRLFLDGTWKTIEVDTRIPCTSNGVPAFARSRDGTELYPCLLEKACAKVYGSYHALRGGNMGEALFDLTGATVDDVNLSRLGPEHLGTELWETLKRHYVQGDVIACGHFTTEGEADHGHSAKGLLVNHAYSVTAVKEPKARGPKGVPRLLQVMNPWGKFEWTGAWSARSKEWTKELRQELGEDEESDGLFWMELGDFTRFFNRLHICRAGLVSDEACSQVNFEVLLNRDTAGGCSNFHSFLKNAMFRVVVQKPIEVSVTVAQPDVRSEARLSGIHMTYPQVGITLLSQDVVPGVDTDAACCTMNRRQVLQKTSFWNKRDVSLVFTAEPLPAGKFAQKEYRVVPSVFFPDDPGMGRFTVSFSWRGPQDAVAVSRVTTGAQSEVVLSGKLVAAARGSGSFAGQPCYKVTSPSSPVALSVILLKATELLAKWTDADPFHSVLHGLFDKFDADDNGVLNKKEMWALFDALAKEAPPDAPSLDEETREAVFAEINRDKSGSVMIGQFIAQSNALATILRVTRAELPGRVQFLAERLGVKGQRRVSSPSGSPASPPTKPAGGATAAGSPNRLKPGAAGPRSGAEDFSQVYAAVAPLRCHSAHYARAESSLAPGCGTQLPVLNNAAVVSWSFVVEQSEFFLAPFVREGNVACSFELRVLSSLPDLTVELAAAPPPGSEAADATSVAAPLGAGGGLAKAKAGPAAKGKAKAKAAGPSMQTAQKAFNDLGGLYGSLG